MNPPSAIAMPTRRFGRTEIDMPVFSCGGMRYQHSWDGEGTPEIPRESQDNVAACVARSLELGINHIETARGYGTSELQLGKVLPDYPRDSLIVQTKIGPREKAEDFLESFEISMRHLKLTYVDLLAIHGINNRETLEWSLRPGGCLDAARRLKAEGRCRHIGFSTHGPVPVLIDAVNSGGFDYINLHWYFVNDINWPVVQAARHQDMGVFIISPNDKGGKLYEPPQKLVDLCAPLSPMQFNDLYCLCRSKVHTLSLGAAKPSDFDNHIEGLVHYENRHAITAPIVERLRAEMDRVLGADWCRRWYTGLPEFDRVPGEINIREILRLWNFAKALDMVEFAKMRYNLLGNGGHWFPGAMASEVDDAALKPILQHSPFAGRIPDILREAHELLFEAPKKRLSEGG